MLHQQQVKAKSSDPILIKEDDHVLVGGGVKNGVFNALAYNNLTTCAEGNDALMSKLMYGMAMLAASLFIFIDIPSSYFGMVSNLAIGVLILVGCHFFYQGYLVRQAVCAVREAAIDPSYAGAE
jgi:hypothetical protein